MIDVAKVSFKAMMSSQSLVDVAGEQNVSETVPDISYPPVDSVGDTVCGGSKGFLSFL